MLRGMIVALRGMRYKSNSVYCQMCGNDLTSTIGFVCSDGKVYCPEVLPYET